ncbi:MAG: hypothetical protein JW947_06660 [Sedimentisphaerales bacterium]|nr:hypothetical protein [Sedimentisphaerales bacterium]
MNTILEQINSTGYKFVDFALPMLLQSAALIMVLLLADVLLRKKVRAVFRYWLWMLVLIKLILPTTLSSPVSIGSWFGDELASIKVSAPSIVAQPINAQHGLRHMPQIIETEIVPAAVTPQPDISLEMTPPLTVEPITTEVVVSAAMTMTSLTWQGIVFLVWAAVVIAMGLLLLQRAIFVTGLVAQAQNPPPLMNDAFNFCCGQMGIKGKVSLKVSANTASPAVCGLFRPVILVPQNLTPTLGSSHLRMVFLHELAHIKRGDLWLNLVQTILQIIYFYNPLLWLANSIIRKIREQAVDEAVQAALGANAHQYPQTLVDVAKIAFNRPVLSLRLIGVVESKSALKGRIERMLNRPIPKTAKLGFIGLIVLLIFAVIVLPMAKAKSKSPEFVIKGIVTDAETGRPIAGAKVGDDKYAGGQFWTTTDSNGCYSYNTWYEEHNIKCEASGYKTKNTGFGTKLFGSEKEKVLDFVLEPSNSPQNTVEGKKQQPSDINTKKREIAAKLETLYERLDNLQRDLDLAERGLGEVRDRWNISGLEENSYVHPIIERFSRLQKERDDCALEISQVKARVGNLQKQAQTEQEKKYLKDTENLLVELQAKLDELEKMRTEAELKTRELNLARVQYKQRAAIRDERLQRLNEIKAQIEQLKLMYEDPEVFATPVEVEKTVQRVKFKPKGVFNPTTAKKLLDAFGDVVQFRVTTHHFRTAVEDNKLVGFILTDSSAEQKAIKLMLDGSDKLEFVNSEAVTEDKLAEHYAMGQPGLAGNINVKDKENTKVSIANQPVELKEPTKTAPQQNPLNEAVYKQLDRTVDLSGLTPNMPFSEAIALLKNSVDPPLKIVVLWQDLFDNTDIDQSTQINMDAISSTRLGTALKLLLKSVSTGFAELDYTIEDGVIFIGQEESLPKKFETRVYDISDLISSTAGAGDIARVIIKTVEPERWETTDGDGRVDIYDNKLVFYQTIEIHKQIQDVLQNLRSAPIEKN